MQRDKYLSVTALSQYIKRKFEVDPYLGRVYLVGEISNFRMRPNAHQYFSLKDDKAKISAIMFKNAFSRLKFQPEEGMKVLITGRISVYEPSGTYQIYIDSMEPDGVGALYQAYEQLKQKLQVEGAFDLPKKEITKFPRKIAIITSESGAVIRDIITTVSRRYPIAQLVLYPAVVQGDKAADDIVRQIKRVNDHGDFDTLIIGRGGGSIEDLWPFNEERVARAIIDSNIPVISSVGHETDTTIADLVADVRAATPTAAAELATPDLTQLVLTINDYKSRIAASQNRRINTAIDELNKIKSRPIMQHPERIYDVYVQKLDQLKLMLFNNIRTNLRSISNTLQLNTQQLINNNPQSLIQHQMSNLKLLNEKLNTNTNNIYVQNRNEFKNQLDKLDSLSPLKTLSRGYSVVTKDDKILNQTKDFEINDKIEIKVSDGEISAIVDEVK
ncbi:exodeoxyribonuclease 7 large subunit [Companilactobacillus sp. RD055328]|uniref:exodeoxyribonuclease VII large subunit n=1 Tax=Companilactobacillus sp. RD055328 TaxID=2916634 RepID=UPI001FC85F88|nr:exodeoxyribonuclease VII large subunit [Companilactobacillus sp. RD055328]GKQ42554.1 exodeoxyribonuclease 7 large subunit [Companilactobacillus sp. RD055328]